MITVDEIKNMSRLLPEERRELQELYLNWRTLRDNKDYAAADPLREKLKEWDSNVFEDGIWHPNFESRDNWKRRITNRMAKYGVEIYPYTHGYS